MIPMNTPHIVRALREKYGLTDMQVMEVCIGRLKEGDPFAKVGKVFLILYGPEFAKSFQARMATLHPDVDDLFGYQLCVAVKEITGVDVVDLTNLKGGGQ